MYGLNRSDHTVEANEMVVDKHFADVSKMIVDKLRRKVI